MQSATSTWSVYNKHHDFSIAGFQRFYLPALTWRSAHLQVETLGGVPGNGGMEVFEWWRAECHLMLGNVKQVCTRGS